MLKFWKAISGSLKWNRAIDLVRDQNYESAVQKLYKIPQTGPLAVEVSLMLAVCHLNLEQPKLASTSLSQSRELLNQFKKKFSQLEYEYLSAYINVAAQIASRGSGLDEYHAHPDWQKIELSLVPRHYLSKFPLREHPLWDEEMIN